MVIWLRLSWLLLVTLTSDWLRVVLSRDFTLKDIINLHPSATPYPGGFKCFTCEDADDNYSCNRWAPDQYCPEEADSVMFLILQRHQILLHTPPDEQWWGEHVRDEALRGSG
ncbi:hypothetical protein AOLI_G00002330 [Acnodon oligacanthus]